MFKKKKNCRKLFSSLYFHNISIIMKDKQINKLNNPILEAEFFQKQKEP